MTTGEIAAIIGHAIGGGAFTWMYLSRLRAVADLEIEKLWRDHYERSSKGWRDVAHLNAGLEPPEDKP